MTKELISSVGTSSRANGQYQEDVFDIRNSALDVIGKANFRLSDQVNLTTTVGWSYNDESILEYLEI